MQSPYEDPLARQQPLPRGPVLDWSSFKSVNVPNIHSIEDLPQISFTTSGRAAIYQALLQLKLPTDSVVLVPTYHCPTMVAPVLLAQLQVAFFGVQSDGLPLLASIDEATAHKSKAMLVPHYFGLAKSLKEVRQWCDARNIALIEDCAHCYFGQAGEKPVGAWGDYATASLSKFFPVPEAGLLASMHRPIPKIPLEKPSAKAQIKGWIDVIELAIHHKRLVGIQSLFNFLFKLKNSGAPISNISEPELQPSMQSMMRDCDMPRIQQKPLSSSMALKSILPRGVIISKRQINFSIYLKYFKNTPGAEPLYPLASEPTDATAPYVFPLWVDKPDYIYKKLRSLGLPVFRWDRIWEGTPHLPGDVGPSWSHHVLQLLCHQDLRSEDIHRTAKTILHFLNSPPTDA